jgi:glycerol-3-phosphate acyltransferase PlsY
MINNSDWKIMSLFDKMSSLSAAVNLMVSLELSFQILGRCYSSFLLFDSGDGVSENDITRILMVKARKILFIIITTIIFF